MQIQEPESNVDDDLGMHEEVDFSTGVQGKYADRFKGMVRAVALEADVAEVFQTSAQVNEALRFLIELNKSTDALFGTHHTATQNVLAEEKTAYEVNVDE